MPTKYTIPKKRRTVRTIRMSNGSTLTAEVDDATNKLYWFRDGKYITPSAMKNYTFYDSKIKSRRRLDAYPEMVVGAGKVEATGANTPVYTPSLDYLEKRKRDKEDIAIKREKNQVIPWSEDIITLKTSGRMNLADIPISELDSIAVNSGRSNTPIKQNLGLVGKESTFGGYSHLLRRENGASLGLSPHLLTNNHAYYKSPEEDYLNASYKKYGDDEQGSVAAEKDAKWNLRNNNIIDRTPHYSHYIMADAFKRYAEAPNKYNPGQGNYVPMVNAIGEEVWSDPQIQQWWSAQGKAQYERGQKEGMAYGGQLKNSWSSLTMRQRADIIKLALSSGIYDLDTIRSVYNEFASGGNIK